MAAGCVYVAVMGPLNWDFQQKEYVVIYGMSTRVTFTSAI